MIVTSCGPELAAVVFKSIVTCVGSTYVTEFTMTPPLTLADIRFGKPTPGSKNPEPDDDVPVMVTVVEDNPAETLELAEVGPAGGGAISLTTSTP